ncbi:matrix metalloproteinase-24-like protein [Leptotrombidium deliense]|uniref:Matrix metalloproteinase-24-like protein n=1 Tax=Leptotrombidium deliense TaxID=299467 RepID=A0A443SVD4_9ACAR|nr:matrix metalloproteinase-24-like protein [Leptotrombidium deliense]
MLVYVIYMFIFVFVLGAIEINSGGMIHVLQYLRMYGYLPPEVSIITNDDYMRSLKTFQKYYGLKSTGVADNRTIELMRQTRCGNRDVNENAAGIANLHGFFARTANNLTHSYSILCSLYKIKWTKTHLTVKVLNSPANISLDETVKLFADAIHVFQDLALINFTILDASHPSSGDIQIVFTSKEHGDETNFDGKGGVYCHVFHPIEGGDIHFDIDEYVLDFNSTVTESINMKATFLHAIGHSIGLSHTNDPNSIMFAFSHNNTVASEIDASSVQLLYNWRPGSKNSAMNIVFDTILDDYHLCVNSKFDAITRDPRTGHLYIFLSDHFWLLEMNFGIVSGYPKQMGNPENFDKHEGNVIAAVTIDANIFIFHEIKGEEFVTVYDADQMSKTEQPFAVTKTKGHKIKAAFIEVNSDVFLTSENGDVGTVFAVSTIHNAFRYGNESLYLFTDNTYNRFNLKTRALTVNAKPKYPRETAIWFLLCRNPLPSSHDSMFTHTDHLHALLFTILSVIVSEIVLK